MIKENITDLENAIKIVEEKLEDDDSGEFIESDAFREIYARLKKLEDRMDGQIESLPYDTAHEKRFDEFDDLRESFEKCKKRIKKIEDNTDSNNGNDNSGMFDDDN